MVVKVTGFNQLFRPTIKIIEPGLPGLSGLYALAEATIAIKRGEVTY